MVQNNKVLTVSYGTFSCTLEGFEDSFDTMKAIAEYFRDLAADDRYFGAEPPQPDADMLARIAQREIARQVEARSSEGGIHLRAATAETTASALSPAVDTPAPAAPSAPEETAADPETPSRPLIATSGSVEETAPAQDHTAAEDDTADLSADTVAETAAEDHPDATSDSDAFLWGVNTTLTASDDDDEDQDAEMSASQRRDEDTVPAHDSIAAKLQRIRAVVAKAPAEEEDFTEDEHAESLQADQHNELEHVLSHVEPSDETSEGQARDVAADPDLDLDAFTEEEESVSDVLDRLNLTGSDLDEDADEDPTQPAASDADKEPAKPAAAPPAQSDAAEQAAPSEAADAPAADTPSAQPAPGPVTPRRPARGRVIRVKRAQVDANLIDSTAEDLSDAPAPAAAAPAETPSRPAAPAASSLSDDDEAELMAELAAVEAELVASSGDETDANAAHEDDDADDPRSGDAQAASESPASPARPARDILTASDRSPDGDVSRLMAAADDRLSHEDATTSRETYNQLRAAVAAAQADSDGSDDARREARTQAFRADLASVVRPSRGGTGADGRPQESARPAPLKLVAEQRIDAASAPEQPATDATRPAERKPTAAAAPVRPRRVSSALLQADDEDTPPRTEDSAFATFAAEKGAVELHELLEAAASYMSFVEGRESFSRPQLINKVRMLDGQDDFNREDSLRSFGQLLREGKLKKASNGRFSVSSQIGFRPGDRAAG
ncbi:chemotaxis protein CheA [Epibacterium sp. MM17-32]|uniref:chemotaxis protein CheA n=1 Tax=Epibacterium sp. MM17-32 TaxID=2917734 RepID=UPI001EF565AF|nr:chemotaxis protein CheA [Epibacterium sp. MM17-32]MCG7627536.1 chemotaxis protein CheA [Epibacterium sp. MM17-32]